MVVQIQVKARGPVFDGRAANAVKGFLLAATGAVAGEGVNLVQASGRGDYKHPTSYYENHIVTDMAQPDSTIVWDSDVIYGPWLEGLGSRNQTTKFKGYSTFRKTTPVLAQRAGPIAYRILDRYVAAMN